MPLTIAVTSTCASPPLQSPAQPVPVGATGVKVTTLLSVKALTFKASVVVAPRLSRAVMVTSVSATTFLGITVNLNDVVDEPVTVGAATTTALLEATVYGAVPPLMVKSMGVSGKTSCAAGNMANGMTGGVGGVVGVVLAVPLPPQETSSELIAPNMATRAARFAQLPVLLKKVLIATAVSF